jgi:hypothetical protein
MRKKAETNITMPQFMTDPNLLGVDSTQFAPWLTFWRAAEALPPEPGDIEFFSKCTRRTRWPTKPAKIIIAIIGRRGMKSSNASMKASKDAIGKHSLARGEWCTIALVDPTRVQARINRDYISGYFHESPYLKSLVVGETNDTITLKNRTRIIVLTSDFKSVRGFACKLVILDEACFLGSEGARSDTECVRALLPSLATLDGTLLVFSSPHGKWGYVWEQYQKYFGVDDPNTLIWQGSSVLMNPQLDKAMVDLAMEQDPQGGKSEWLALFRDDVDQFLSLEIIERVIIPGRIELPYTQKFSYSGFTDPSGGGPDAFCLAIGHSENGKAVQDVLRTRRGDPHEIVKEYSELLKKYSLHEVTGDRYSGSWCSEAFTRETIRYIPSGLNKSEIFLAALPYITSQMVELIDSKELIKELRLLERRTSATGKDIISHPQSMGGGVPHDDLANVSCGLIASLLSGKCGEPALLGFVRCQWQDEMRKTDPALIQTRRCPLTSARMSENDTCNVPRRPITCNGCPAQNSSN